VWNTAASAVAKVKRLFLQEKTMEATKQKEEKRKNLSPRNRKACHSVSTALQLLRK
jgi:hypothetical protein